MRGRSVFPQGTVKTHFFFPQEKETVFGIQRKRGSQRGQVAPNRVSAARLSVPIEVRPRPQWTTWAEQGQAVVLSPLFSPPGPVGVGTRLRLSHRFPLPSYCGARRPRRAKPLPRRTLIRPCGPPSPCKGEGFWTLILPFPPGGGTVAASAAGGGGASSAHTPA